MTSVASTEQSETVKFSGEVVLIAKAFCKSFDISINIFNFLDENDYDVFLQILYNTIIKVYIFIHMK